jgi:hypothetical protein
MLSSYSHSISTSKTLKASPNLGTLWTAAACKVYCFFFLCVETLSSLVSHANKKKKKNYNFLQKNNFSTMFQNE